MSSLSQVRNLTDEPIDGETEKIKAQSCAAKKSQ